ncbi:MAG: hypothetical protein IIB82_09185 [Bacteroidetes bacterium]|nr:hypothetical protein [Bacteroidota bacterium]
MAEPISPKVNDKWLIKDYGQVNNFRNKRYSLLNDFTGFRTAAFID